MIFEEIVAAVCEKLNYSSDEAKSRVGRNINARYHRVTSSIGLDTSRRTTVSKAATIGNKFITFTGIEKILSVIDKTDPDAPIVLEQITVYELESLNQKQEPPRKYAIYSMGPASVTIELDCTPTTGFTLYADGLVVIDTLSGSDRPSFPESFHDILVFGALADEYRKLEKVQFYHDAEADYERRLSDLRMFIAKSAYIDQTQGRYSAGRGPLTPVQRWFQW